MCASAAILHINIPDVYRRIPGCVMHCQPDCTMSMRVTIDVAVILNMRYTTCVHENPGPLVGLLAKVNVKVPQRFDSQPPVHQCHGASRVCLCTMYLLLLKSQDTNIISGYRISNSDEFLCSAFRPVQAINEGSNVWQRKASVRVLPGLHRARVGDEGIYKERRGLRWC
jgi:hypothetical protein